MALPLLHQPGLLLETKREHQNHHITTVLCTSFDKIRITSQQRSTPGSIDSYHVLVRCRSPFKHFLVGIQPAVTHAYMTRVLEAQNSTTLVHGPVPRALCRGFVYTRCTATVVVRIWWNAVKIVAPSSTYRGSKYFARFLLSILGFCPENTSHIMSLARHSVFQPSKVLSAHLQRIEGIAHRPCYTLLIPHVSTCTNSSSEIV